MKNKISGIPSFSHSGLAGDLIWQIPAMIDLANREGSDKFILYLKINVPTFFSEPHPNGAVMLTRTGAESLMSLIEKQDYIGNVSIWNGEPVDYDMDKFRLIQPLGTGVIAYWPCRVFSCTPDLSRPWIKLYMDRKPDHKQILLARSTRYRNPTLDYRHLSGKAYFVGLESENEMSLPRLDTIDIRSMAAQIANCRIVFCNQSLAYALASALDVPRVLEECPLCPNVPPTTRNCMVVWTQEQLDGVISSLT